MNDTQLICEMIFKAHESYVEFLSTSNDAAAAWHYADAQNYKKIAGRCVDRASK
jgi:hypothetical protein